MTANGPCRRDALLYCFVTGEILCRSSPTAVSAASNRRRGTTSALSPAMVVNTVLICQIACLDIVHSCCDPLLSAI